MRKAPGFCEVILNVDCEIVGARSARPPFNRLRRERRPRRSAVLCWS